MPETLLPDTFAAETHLPMIRIAARFILAVTLAVPVASLIPAGDDGAWAQSSRPGIEMMPLAPPAGFGAPPPGAGQPTAPQPRRPQPAQPAQPAQRPPVPAQVPPAAQVPAPPVPGDTDGDMVVQPPTQKIANAFATFAGLDKITGRITSFDVGLGETAQFGALQVTPRVCYTRPANETQNTTSFAEVNEVTLKGEAKRIFTGWMFAASPGLHGVEHPIYDVWLIGCKASAPVTARPFGQ